MSVRNVVRDLGEGFNVGFGLFDADTTKSLDSNSLLELAE